MRKSMIGAAVIAGLTLSGCANMNQQTHRNCEVRSKDVLYNVSEGTTDRTKRVSTSCGTFDVEDALEVGHFNSYDLWTSLQEGEVYDIKTGGHRIGFLSTFPIVLEVHGPK